MRKSELRLCPFTVSTFRAKTPNPTVKRSARPHCCKWLDLLIIDVAEARKQIAARTQELEEAKAMIAQDKAVMGGEPLPLGDHSPFI